MAGSPIFDLQELCIIKLVWGPYGGNDGLGKKNETNVQQYELNKTNYYFDEVILMIALFN